MAASSHLAARLINIKQLVLNGCGPLGGFEFAAALWEPNGCAFDYGAGEGGAIWLHADLISSNWLRSQNRFDFFFRPRARPLGRDRPK